eukprot:403364209
MKRLQSVILLAAGFVALSTQYQDDLVSNAKLQPTIMPPPKQITHGTGQAFIDPCQFNLKQEKQFLKGSEHIENLYSYYTKRLFPKFSFESCSSYDTLKTVDLKLLKHLNLKLNSGEITELLSPHLHETDESYDLKILMDTDEIQITANQYVGLVRGMATVSQLIQKSHTKEGVFEVNHLPLDIQDAPRYAYRGFMLDTSRHYISVDIIKQLLDSLALAKFSVFHWHIVDDESFPIELDSFPNISKNGAFSADKVYTKTNVQGIVSYALTLGLRVIPEFDNPGHTRAIAMDPEFRDIMRCWSKDWSSTVPGAYRIQGMRTGVLDPTYDQTFDLIKGIFTDLNSLFPDNMLMLGGDEVLTSCYNENPKLQDFMTKNNIKDLQGVFQYHLEKSRGILKTVNSNKVALYWSNEDTLYLKHNPDDVLLWWGQSKNLDQLKATYPQNKFVMVVGDAYYLDCGRGNKYGANSWCDPFKTWWYIYQFEPTDYLNDGSVIGGQVASWSEQISDYNLLATIWPRAAAMVDKMWGPKVPLDLQSLAARLIAFNQQLNNFGIPSSPITDGYCEQNNAQCFIKKQTQEPFEKIDSQINRFYSHE